MAKPTENKKDEKLVEIPTGTLISATKKLDIGELEAAASAAAYIFERDDEELKHYGAAMAGK
jgi:hypothetical protein